MALDEFELGFEQSVQGDSGTWYRNVQKLGTGGNAATFLVVATSGGFKGCPFALKVFRRLSKPERRTPFLQEIAFLRSIRHPAIMPVFDEGAFYKRHPFVVAEYLPATLRQVIRSGSATTVEKLSFAVQLLGALVFLDKLPNPVIHRDIKPENIFIKGRSCILGDFGLMKIAEEDKEVIKESLGVGMPFYYRTPDLVEYLRDGRGPTTRSDVFQLGLVLAELFSGRNPLRPSQDFMSNLELEPIADIPGEMQAEITNVLSRMLQIEPADRMPATTLIDTWQGLFFRAAEAKARLDGKVF